MTRLPQLDGLRAVAVFGVIWLHFPPVAGFPVSLAFTAVGEQLRVSTIGVDLFFALSGFLITRILLNERVTTGSIAFTDFYVKRSARIFPIYYISLAVCLACFAMPAKEVVLSALYLSDYNLINYYSINDHTSPLSHSWSLAVEEQFYLVWPFVIAWTRLGTMRRVTGVIVPAIAIACMALAYLLSNSIDAEALIFGAAPIRMLTISLGAYLACREFDRAPLTVRQGGALALAGLAGLLIMQAARTRGIIAGPIYHAFGNIGFAVLAMGLLAIVLPSRPSVLQAVLCWPPMRYVGRISYGLYLYHFIILHLLGIHDSRDGAPAVVICAAAALTFGTAAISFHFIENPLIQAARRQRHFALATPIRADLPNA